MPRTLLHSDTAKPLQPLLSFLIVSCFWENIRINALGTEKIEKNGKGEKRIVAIALIRTVILYVVTMVAVRCMGKRQLGELEPMELVVTFLISDLATLPMQDLEAPLLNSIVPIAALVLLEIFTSVLSMKCSWLHRIMSGRYTLLINEGKLNQTELKRSHMTVEEVMEELRQSGILTLEQVRYCVLETGGKISVLSVDEAEADSLPLMLIADGKMLRQNLQTAGLSKADLQTILKEQGIQKIRDVFLLYTVQGKYTCIRRNIK